MRIVRRAILYSLLLLCVTAQASEWEFVTVSKSDGSSFYVNGLSTRTEGQIRTAWIKQELLPHTKKGAGPFSSKWESSIVTLIAFDCARESLRLQSSVAYFEDGTNTSAQFGADETWAPIPPDSVFNQELQFICTWKPK